MSIFDSIGTIFEGGLFARAIEPRVGEAREEESFAGKCLNCGTERVGPHCHHCGQKAHIHKTMREFGHDLVHGALHFDGKVWRTVPLLAWRPGKLTRRYIDGERARFVSPMALFLFSVFLMFAVFQLAGITPPTELDPRIEAAGADRRTDAEQELAALRNVRAEMGKDNPAAPLIDARIAALAKQAGEPPVKLSPDGEKVVLAENDSGGRLTFNRTGIPLLDKGIDKWRENPGLMAYKLQSNGYKFSWVLIPLSLPFMWIMFFWRRRFGMYDHAVFVTYSLSFMTLFYVSLVLLGSLGVATDVLVPLAMFVPLLHIYKQIRGAYELRRFSALWRTAALSLFILLILVLFLDLLLVLGAVG